MVRKTGLVLRLEEEGVCVCESALNRTASPHLPARSLPSTLALPTSRCNWLTGGEGGEGNRRCTKYVPHHEKLS